MAAMRVDGPMLGRLLDEAVQIGPMTRTPATSVRAKAVSSSVRQRHWISPSPTAGLLRGFTSSW